MDMVIFTGVEEEEEFATKRALECDRITRTGEMKTRRLGKAPEKWYLNFSRIVGFTAVFIGVLLLVLTVSAILR
jgi:hypothetical protein